MSAVKEKIPHLSNLKVADSGGRGNYRIDILMGMDFHWPILSGRIIREGRNEPDRNEFEVRLVCKCSDGLYLKGSNFRANSRKFLLAKCP